MKKTITEIPENNEEKEITAESKSSFLYSFSFLPKEKNDAINIVYAFCRKTDDIVDDESEPDVKAARIKEWRNELEKALNEGDSIFPLLKKVAAVVRKFNIPVFPFYELINGMEMDLKKHRYNNFSELADYCFKVASTVGLMSIEIFGYKNEKTREFAINLGIALQLTNIIRDVKADAEAGRIYIPLEDMRHFSYTEKELLNNVYNDNFKRLMKFECNRARYFYEEANKNLTKEDKGLMFSARIMEMIYFRVLKKIERNNYNIFEGKVGISLLSKAAITAGVFLKYRIFYGFE
ncbi:MAG: squalene/phytoene synthase family protein [Ignavibacteria bacterium]|nr:squalene/phytoene synthase family protein [Ignavibacteria bacterium]